MSVTHLPCWGAGHIFLSWGRHCAIYVIDSWCPPGPSPSLEGHPPVLASGASIMTKEGPWGLWGLEGKGKGKFQAVCYRQRVITVRRPRLVVRPRMTLLSRACAGAALFSVSLHRSLWQHCVTSEPLLTWPCWLLSEVHELAHSFLTRFPFRGSTAHRRGKRIRPDLLCTLDPTEHHSFLTTAIAMTNPSPVSSLGLMISNDPEGLELPLTCDDSFAVVGVGWTDLRLLTVGTAGTHMTLKCPD